MAQRGTTLQCPGAGHLLSPLPVPLPTMGVAAPGLIYLGFECLLRGTLRARVHFAYLIDKRADKVNETHLQLWKLSSFPAVHHGLWEDTSSP